MSNPLYEKLLLHRIRTSGDGEAFGKLYDLYIQRIYRFVYFKVSSTEEAQDVTSDTFLRLWQFLQAGNAVQHVGALLYEIARNTIIDHKRRHRPTESIDEQFALEIPDVQGLAKIHRTAEVAEVLAAVRLLKDEYREVLVMRHVDGLSASEIGVLLKKSPGAVRVLLHRALETVRTLLEPAKEK
jgi:RNA polymerase sigma-70 factor (ECF subfamily)